MAARDRVCRLSSRIARRLRDVQVSCGSGRRNKDQDHVPECRGYAGDDILPVSHKNAGTAGFGCVCILDIPHKRPSLACEDALDTGFPVGVQYFDYHVDLYGAQV